jgi:hypothetical protein
MGLIEQIKDAKASKKQQLLLTCFNHNRDSAEEAIQDILGILV